MAFRYSVELRNAGLDARIAAVGPDPVCKLYSSGQSTGSIAKGELAAIPLPKDWMTKADDGVVTNNGEWHGVAKAEGKAKSYRICDKAGTCHIEGAIPEDMKLDNPHLAPGQKVTVEVFTIRSGNG